MAVGIVAVKTLPPMPIPKLVARRFCMPIKNAAACAASRAPLWSLTQPCPVGSKKSSSASCFTGHFGRPDPDKYHTCDGTDDAPGSSYDQPDCGLWELC